MPHLFLEHLSAGMYHILHDLYLEKYSDEMSLLVEEIADDIRDFNKKVVKTSKSDHGLGLAKAEATPSKSHKTGSRGSLTGRSSPRFTSCNVVVLLASAESICNMCL